jgi:TPR repeat protein
MNLGAMYGNGEGVPRDLVQADAWFILASGKGVAEAARAATAVQSHMTPEQIAQARQRAAAWSKAHPI